MQGAGLLLALILAVLVIPGSHRQTEMHTDQCGLCKLWYSATHLRFHHTRTCAARVEPPLANASSQFHDGEDQQTDAPSPGLRDDTPPPPSPTCGAPGGDAAAPQAPGDGAAAGNGAAAGTSATNEFLYQQRCAAGEARDIPFNRTVEAYCVKIGLSVAQLQGLIDLFGPHDSYVPSGKSAAEVFTCVLNDSLGPGFQHIDLTKRFGFDDDQAGAMVLSVRTDPVRCVLDLLENCDDEWSMQPQHLEVDGETAYNQAWTARRWRDVQVCGDGTCCAPCLLVSGCRFRDAAM